MSSYQDSLTSKRKTRYGGILSLNMLKGRHRGHRVGISKSLSLTEHNMTKHKLESTICKSYLEPQDEEPIVQLSTLLDLINNREWDLLSKELTPETLRAVDSGSLLHLALNSNAPSSIIYQITNGMHNSVSHRDAKGRLPLHVAISKVSRPSIISHLIKLNPKACTSKDNQGKTPLHVCFDDKVFHTIKPPQFNKLVGTLVQTSQDALIMEDEDMRCPVELAILSKAPQKTILFLQVVKLEYMRQKNTSLLSQ
jgi:ankyrin repeat protein